LVILVALSLLSSGCATMIRGTEEPLSVTSDPSGALAELSNGQKCITPCQVSLKRNQSVMVKFTKDGYEAESLSVFPTLAGAGVILGGVIDYGTGAVYSLTPNPAHVLLKPSRSGEQSTSQSTLDAKPKKTLQEELDDLDRMKKEGTITGDEYKTLRKNLIDNRT
jgi:hypothetical protein